MRPWPWWPRRRGGRGASRPGPGAVPLGVLAVAARREQQRREGPGGAPASRSPTARRAGTSAPGARPRPSAGRWRAAARRRPPTRRCRSRSPRPDASTVRTERRQPARRQQDSPWRRALASSSATRRSGNRMLTISQMASATSSSRPGAVDDRPAVGVLHGLQEEAVVDPAVERSPADSSAVLRRGAAGARRRRGHLEQHHQVGPGPVGRPSGTAAPPRRPAAAAVALVGDRRAGEAVADHRAAGVEAGSTTSATCCARSAAISSASARSVMSRSGESSTRRRTSAPSGESPGSKVSSARPPRRSASRRAWVDLPLPSPPSKAMKWPRHPSSSALGLGRVGRPGRSRVVLLVAAPHLGERAGQPGHQLGTLLEQELVERVGGARRRRDRGGGAQRHGGQHAGAHDDQAGEPQGEPHAGDGDRDAADRDLAPRSTLSVEQAGQERARPRRRAARRTAPACRAR